MDTGALRAALSATGVLIDVGLATLRVRCDVPDLAPALRAAYREHAFVTTAEFADLHIDIVRPAGLRRWLQPQAVFRSDGDSPFEPFPAANAFPLLEWGANWLIGQRLNHALLLHAAALAKDGFALVLPAMPGSGKSTLAAALALRGWRLLSDEFGAWDVESAAFRAVLKPIALKNESIAVIRRFEPNAPLGPEFPNTRKGTVAHLAAEPAAVAARHEGTRPGAFILPRWQAGSALSMEPIDAHALFGSIAFNAFNYRLLGSVGFESALELARRCPAWQLVYSDLDEAIAAIDALWPQVVDQATG